MKMSVQHIIKYWFKNRDVVHNYNYFDAHSYAQYYLYSDKLACIAGLHFFLWGALRSYDPNPFFMSQYYQKKYNLDKREVPVVHYLLYGKKHRHKINIYQDAQFFFKQPISQDYLRIETTVRKVIIGQQQKKRDKLCFYAQFDPEGIIDQHVILFIQELSRCGFEIVFISASPTLYEEEIMKVSAYCSRIIHKKNIGIDFHSWAVAVKLQTRLELYTQVVFTNDSFYGPCNNLKTIFKNMEKRHVDVWSLADYAVPGHYCLQSFFLCFNSKPIQNGFIYNYFERYILYTQKKWIVARHEMGLTPLLRDCGYTISAYCQMRKIKKMIRHTYGEKYIYHRNQVRLTKAMNMMYFFWDFLIQECQFPVLKVSVLLFNIAKSPANAQAVISATNYPFAFVVAHVRRIRKYYKKFM